MSLARRAGKGDVTPRYMEELKVKKKNIYICIHTHIYIYIYIYVCVSSMPISQRIQHIPIIIMPRVEASETLAKVMLAVSRAWCRGLLLDIGGRIHRCLCLD